MKPRPQQLAELREELLDFYRFRQGHGEALTFAGCLRGHRRQCETNLRDSLGTSGEQMWRDRLSLCDELSLAEGIGP